MCAKATDVLVYRRVKESVYTKYIKESTARSAELKEAKKESTVWSIEFKTEDIATESAVRFIEFETKDIATESTVRRAR